MSMFSIVMSLVLIILLGGISVTMIETYTDRVARRISERDQLRFRRAVRRLIRVKWLAAIATFDKQPKPLNIYREMNFSHRTINR